MQWGSSITFFYAGENSLVGTIPSEWGSLWTKLRAFYASNNSLEGTLPSTWSPTLERLRLFGNKLQGSLPLRWAQLTRLAVLFLHDNQIS
ncbi:GP46-like surface antigen, putative, partial [Bodo saltans]